jgi:hypothetical protein
MTIDEFSDAVMLPVLDSMPPMERKKMLLLQRQIVHSRAFEWIDRQLEKLNSVEVDPDWVATITSDPSIKILHRKLLRLSQAFPEEL